MWPRRWRRLSKGRWRNTSYMYDVFLARPERNFHVPGWGPDQLNRCEVAADGSLLTRRHFRSHISWYNTIGCLLPCGCARITFWKNSH